MTIEDRIRITAHSHVRISITRRKRCRGGFTITAPNGICREFPSRAIALQFLLAIVRCQRIRYFTLKPAKS